MLWSGFYCNRSRHGNVMTPIRFLFIFAFLCTRSFLKKSLKGVCTCHNCLQFQQILWERFRNSLTRSFNNHKNSETACYPHMCTCARVYESWKQCQWIMRPLTCKHKIWGGKLVIFEALFKNLACFQCSWNLQGMFINNWSLDCRIYKKIYLAVFWKIRNL